MGQFAFVPMTCSQTRRFLMTRFEWTDAAWELRGASFARPNTESSALGRQHLEGAFAVGEEYPGCPGCRADTFVRCANCLELGCWDTTWPLFHCPVCGNSGEVEGGIDSLRTSSGQ